MKLGDTVRLTPDSPLHVQLAPFANAVGCGVETIQDDDDDRLHVCAAFPDQLYGFVLPLSAEEFVVGLGRPDQRRASYSVEVWDASGNHVVEHIGALSNHAAARAAFTAACEARPKHEVTLRQGIRVVECRGLDSETTAMQAGRPALLDPAG